MKGKKIIIICYSLFLLLVAAFWGIREIEENHSNGVFAQIHSNGRTEKVKLWMSPWDDYYLFLPSYADLSQVQICEQIYGQAFLEGAKITGFMDCSDYPLNEPIELIQLPYFGYQWNTLTILQSANLPTMYVDVRSGDMDYIHAQKGNKESGTMRLYSAEGKLEASAIVESFQGRGNSTWYYREKKPYSLRLGADTDLLEMGAASRWILLAEPFDPSFLKNKISYDLARDAGMPYSPDCRWVDLYLNGNYAGLYLLSERNEIHSSRVDLPPESSFLVSWEQEDRLIAQEYPYIKTERDTAIRVHHSAFPLDQVQQMWQSVENAIFAEDGMDPITGKYWHELIDLDSWAKLFLVDEITGDYDGGKLSKFFYYQEIEGVGKIYGGPVWDKDDAFANGQWPILAPNCIVASRSSVVNGREQRMFYGLYQKAEFSARVSELYQKDFLPLLRQLYDTGIEAYADYIASSAELTEIRWSQGYKSKRSVQLRDFLGERMAFLNDYWIENEKFHRVRVLDTYDGSNGEFAIRPGEKIPILPEHELDFGIWGWYRFGTEEPFDVTQPIWEDADIIFKNVE